MNAFLIICEDTFGAHYRPKYHPRQLWKMWCVWYTGPGIKAVKLTGALTREGAQRAQSNLHFVPRIVQK